MYRLVLYVPAWRRRQEIDLETSRKRLYRLVNVVIEEVQVGQVGQKTEEHPEEFRQETQLLVPGQAATGVLHEVRDVGHHWLIVPSERMPLDELRAHLATLNSLARTVPLGTISPGLVLHEHLQRQSLSLRLRRSENRCAGTSLHSTMEQ